VSCKPRPWPRRPTLLPSEPAFSMTFAMAANTSSVVAPGRTAAIPACVGEPHGVVGAQCGIAHLPDGIVAVEVAEIAVEGGAGVEEHDVAGFEPAVARGRRRSGTRRPVRRCRAGRGLRRRRGGRDRCELCGRPRARCRRPKRGPAGFRKPRWRWCRCGGSSRSRPRDFTMRMRHRQADPSVSSALEAVAQRQEIHHRHAQAVFAAELEADAAGSSGQGPGPRPAD
jgi:hypothetical protein